LQPTHNDKLEKLETRKKKSHEKKKVAQTQQKGKEHVGK